MDKPFCPPCAQTRRAIVNLLNTDSPKMNRSAFLNLFSPGPPANFRDIIDLLVQVILALLESKINPEPNGPSPPDDKYASLRETTVTATKTTVPEDVRLFDTPRLINSIRAVADLIPVPGFPSLRKARETMRVANNQTLRHSAANWIAWNEQVRTEMDRLAAKDHINTEADYKAAWMVVAEALESVTESARPTNS